MWYVDGIKTIEPKPLETTLEEATVNNDFTITGIRNPEIIASFTHPSKVMIGENVNIAMLLDNQGEGDGTINWQMEPLENTSQNMTQTGIKLAAGQKITKNIDVTPQNCANYEAKIHINYYNQVDDYINTINSNIKFEVTGPDLFIESMDAQTYTAEQGTTIPLSIIVRNSGEKEVNEFNIEIYELTGEKEAKIDTIEIKSAIIPADYITVTYDYNTARKNTSAEYKLKAKIVTTEKECNTQNNEAITKTIKITPKAQPQEVLEQPIQEVIDEKATEQAPQQEEKTIQDGSPLGYMVLPPVGGEDSPLDKILVIVLIMLVSANLVFFTIYKGNLKIVLQKKPEKVEQLKPAETIEQPIAPIKHVSKEKSEEQLRQEEIRKEIDDAVAAVQKPKQPQIKPQQDNLQKTQQIKTKKEDEQQKIIEETKTKAKITELLDKEKGKEKRKELFKDTIAAAKNNLANKDIKENVLMQKGDEQKGSFLPYDYLIDASKIVSYIHNNKMPRIEIIDKLGKKYPLFLVDLGIRAVHSSKTFEYNYCNKDFSHVQPDTQNYAYVTYWNLVKSVKIMAEKLSLERKEQYNQKEVKSILYNKWNKDQPLVAFLYKEMF